MTDPEIRVDTEFFLEYVEQKVNISTQTVSTATDNLSEESKAGDAEYPGLARFLQRVAPVMTRELEKNASGTDMSLFDFGSSLNAEEGQDANIYWKMLSVDLDARGVVYRDWTGTSYYPASVVKCTVTRNKERIYEIEYKDGSVQSGVKEEYIHVLGDMATQPKSSARPALTAAQLKEGMRVHAKVALKSGQVKYMPGIITKYTSNRNNRSGGLFEVQCDGRSRAEVDLTVDDILVGLYAGLNIEARMPRKVNLQCTGLSWNATGNILAACYGKNDVDGWCDYPGAVCCWNIFGKSLVPENPDFVLDHPSCLMCVCYHPLIPSIIAAGSFNGEIIVWDLTSPEAPLAVSAITEYSHKTPVLSLNWVCSSVSGRSGASQDPASLDSWLLSSVCTGGKALFWSLKNKLAHPVKGATLPKCKAKR
jgi:WD40 repeat protein